MPTAITIYCSYASISTSTIILDGGWLIVDGLSEPRPEVFPDLCPVDIENRDGAHEPYYRLSISVQGAVLLHEIGARTIGALRDIACTD